MTLLAALRIAQHAFGPVRREGRAWTFTTFAPGARVSLSRDRVAVRRCRDREIRCFAIRLLWRSREEVRRAA